MVPGGPSGKEPACQQGTEETWVRSLGQEDPLAEAMATHSIDRGPWWATVHGVARVRHDLATHLNLTTVFLEYAHGL